MDSLFNALLSHNQMMGSVAVSKDGQVIYSRAIGYSEISQAKKTTADTNTRYRIGSISKVFTATMIFQLIDEGKLQPADLLSKYFAALPNAGKITIAQLLNHSSGLLNFTNDPAYSTKLNQRVTHAELLATFEKAKPAFEPGTKNEYSNTNFVVLGFIIEKLDKRTYAEALKSRITSKIGLKNTYYGDKIRPSDNEAFSYNWQGSWQSDTETDMSIPGGAGALVSTASDLNKFIAALFSGKLISEKNLTIMKTIHNGFGSGLFSFPFYERTAFGHGGVIDGFRSQTSYYPADKVTFTYLANGVNTNLNDMCIGVLSILFNKPYQIPGFTSLHLKTTDLDQYLGIYSVASFPLKITISKNDTVLMAQATGQAAFSLEAVQINEFRYQPANITLSFDAAKKQLTLKQNGAVYVLNKE